MDWQFRPPVNERQAFRCSGISLYLAYGIGFTQLAVVLGSPVQHDINHVQMNRHRSKTIASELMFLKVFEANINHSCG